MDAEPSSSRGQDPAVCRAGHPPRGGSSASAVNVMWRGGAVRCSPLLGHWWDPPEPPPPAGPGPDDHGHGGVGGRTGATRPRAGCARGRADGGRTRARSPYGPRVNGGNLLLIRDHCASASPVQRDCSMAPPRGSCQAWRTGRLAFQTRKSDAFLEKARWGAQLAITTSSMNAYIVRL